MPPSRHIRLTQEEDHQLREIEQDPYLKPKVRLRAQVLRLSNRGSNMEKIASYTGRSPASVARDLDRWSERGLEGLADGAAPGNPPRITGEMKGFMEREALRGAHLERYPTRRGTRGGIRARGHPGGGAPASAFDGLLVEAHPLCAQQGARPRRGAGSPRGVGGSQKGAAKGEIVLKYLDESGFYLCLPPTHTWTRKGQAHQHRVKGRWGSEEGRVNLIGTLRVEGEGRERLEYRMLEGGSCNSGEVLLYLDTLAGQAEQEDKPCVVVLDNAPFHTAGVIREREEEWKVRGLVLYRLPAYCPHLNLIEGVWRRLKGFLMPRRFYDSVAELKRAVLHGLRLLEAVEVQCSLGDT